MSAPLKLTVDDLSRLVAFLAAVSAASAEHGVTLGPYCPSEARVSDDAALAIAWDEGAQQYLIDDRSGN